MKKLAFALAYLIGLLAAPASAADDPLEREFKRQIASWQSQVDAAERDAKLVERVSVALYSLDWDGAPAVDAVKAALAPLADNYPDYRLSYSGKQDYCRVLDALAAARLGALNRIIGATYEQTALLQLKQTYHLIQLKRKVSEFKGESLTAEQVDAAFEEVLRDASKSQNKPVTSWTEIDYLREPMGSDKCD